MPAVLSLLRIKNLALVEELEWQMTPGFVAVTGETGAGKSIIIGALQLLLGERADKSLIRTGADLCTVEAVFTGRDLQKLNPELVEAGIEPCEDDLIIKRSFSAAGGTRQFINGSPTTLSILKKLGDELVDLHGPHDHQSLLSPETQLSLLDSFARAEEELEEYRKHYRQLQALLAEHAALDTAETAREQELDLVRHQVAEINSANLVADEEEEIEKRYKLASSSKRLIELASAIANKLSEADDSVLSQLSETQRLLRELEKIDSSIAHLSSAHTASVVELSEIARALSAYAEKLDLDPQQLASLEQRVSLFETLKRKYGGSIADVIAFGERAAERMRKIEGRDVELERLAKEIENIRKHMNRAGEALRKLRAKAAPKLSENIRRNLRDLGFRQSEFEAKLIPLDEPRPNGFDSVELLFSPNPGEPLKSLRAIASSGEISRLMLAIKSALAAHDAIPLLVFDEIDTNVGGEIAHAVGAKMQTLGRDHQVICITHLPQVAATASSHFVVTKDVARGRTFSNLREVTGKDRQEEIARMLGDKSESALKLAANLLGRGD
ncbi:MAG: DNA repair protein RecN [Verrucomicrobia bacterium 13_2_20CM_54_12]|jgi:DNA repair protein RecN (Recombination protein N)|nr:MAG: DNA repair protein RecN [Verrucomicrobia bacterium 13_2_20CM_54_12]OLD72879.1 MAG: DNA repair protein RecN [Verrucomicrobia bacterium 13_1_20CM_54_28]OLD91118.1 MAG: DNA repair protein RecN [Verrucomicrobia bacterium 13_1_20CM_4_54_11]